MNAPYDVERDMTRWMAEVVPTRAPDNLAPSIVARTRSMRPRPGWLARLLEPPMQTQLSLRRAAGLGRSPRMVLVVLLVLALLAGSIVVGSQLLRRPSLPPPFGVAGNGLIAASMASGDLVLVEPDGSNMRQLDLPFTGVGRVSFSRDGTRIAAWATPDASRGTVRSLVVANTDGSGAFEVDPANLVVEPGFRIAWSPDDRRLAFSGSGDRLFVADIDARSIRELGQDETINRRSDPAWAPDGRLAYRCQTTQGVLHLCVMGADLVAERLLDTSPGTEYAFQAPSWSHDGESIAYQVDDLIDHGPADAGWDTATIDLASGTEQILTRGFAEHAILPVWSPDDRHVLFGTEVGPGVVRSDGTGLRLLGDPDCAWGEPSPDGVFLGCVKGDQIALHPIEGGQATIIELGALAESLNWQRLGQ